MPAAYSLGYAYGMRASRRQQQACVGKAAAERVGVRVRVTVTVTVTVRVRGSSFRRVEQRTSNRHIFKALFTYVSTLFGYVDLKFALKIHVASKNCAISEPPT